MMGSLMAIGITSLIAIETIVNIAVVTATVPLRACPAIYKLWGTSLLFHLMGMGILLNISRNSANNLTP